jgi:hypothetical protein
LFLIDLGFEAMRNANVHALVRHYLHASSNLNAIHASHDFGNLQTARNRADYDLDDRRVGLRGYSMLCVERAHRVVSALEACRSGQSRETIRQAIAEYEQRIRPR